MKTEEEYVEFVRQMLDEAVKMLCNNLPAMKEMSMEAIETVFAPKTVFKQLVLATALQTGAMTINQLMHLVRIIDAALSSRSRLIRQLKREQTETETQDEWMDLAERIDQIQGNDIWRSDATCPLYERERIQARIDEFIHLMRRADIFDLMFTLRGGIGRNQFGLLHEGLFSKALAGTKVLVETYHSVVCTALDYVCDSPVPPGEDPIPTEARLAFFNETRHAYGRTALLLSGGAALGFYHVGVVKALMENGLMPRVLGGSSAGSIVCAMIATRTDEECFNDFFEAQGTDAPGHSGRMVYNFFKPVEEKGSQENYLMKKGEIGEVIHNTAGAFRDAKLTWEVFIPIGLRAAASALYDVLTGNRRPQDLLNQNTEHFRQCVRGNVGHFTFQEAFDRTGRILNITVTPKNRSDPPRLLNYLTAPHVLVWSAVVASSSLPGVFEANKLMVKDADGTERYEASSGHSQRYSDGSMEADLPMQQLSEMFNINHFIISQANPHAVMFAGYNANKSVWSNPIVGFMHGVMMFLKDQVRLWLTHVVELVGGRRIAPLFDTSRNMGSTFFTQEYEGRDCDISLIPWLKHRSLLSAMLHLIYNPSEAEFRNWIEAAERETWRHIARIKSHCAEEMTLDRCVQRLRRRMAWEAVGKRRVDVAAGENMGERVPSFFTSRSLVNMGGLSMGDQVNIRLDSEPNPEPASVEPQKAHPDIDGPHMDFNQGWGGKGLHGNRSYASLLSSNKSGLFLEELDDEVDEDAASDQVAGEHTTVSSRSMPPRNEQEELNDGGYIKTTNMAHFYYRKSKSHDQLQFKSKSHDNLEKTQHTTNVSHTKKTSQSQGDLANVVYEALG